VKSVVVFVADKPSSKNCSPCIPLIGTASYKKLREWCNKYNLSPYLLNSHTPYWLKLAERLSAQGLPVVALGIQASKRLTGLNVKHFKAPHPSPRNLQMNNSAVLEQRLQELVVWVRSITELN
jgi:GH35 family endo-1,4-beta-xylanase